MRICSIQDCDRKHEAQGYCRMHYRRLQAHGDPLTVLPAKPYEGRTAAQVKARIASSIKVSPTGCWEWQRSVAKHGYGICTWKGVIGAHRVSYTVHVGAIPKGLWVLHRCDNRVCVNPEHLFLGTAIDNNADMDAKGRANRVGFTRQPTPEERARGERNGGNKISAETALAIREAPGLQREIAKRYGVSEPLVSAIKRRRLWKDL